ncbi:MAG: hypothetical protein FJ104_02070 [Deltaproteobacteria bacterium]|nr:hypothetical protein [Deltaproteobacteria bacterium]
MPSPRRHSARTLPLAALLAAVASACGQDAPPRIGSRAGDGGPVDGASPTPDLAHDFETVVIGPGEDSDELCQQWTPGHTEPLAVGTLRMESTGGFHHMNFFYVPEDHLPGPDGTFRCADRGYDMQLAAIVGGVLFAQSTQAQAEVQQFGAGAVVEVPPGFKIVGNLHVVNPTSEPLDARLRFEFFTLPESEITARLTGFLLQYGALDIPARARSRFSTSCTFDARHEALFGRPADFGIRWLLPHYHALGELLRVELLRGGSGEVLVETTRPIGEPVGKAFDPPVTLAEGDQIRLTCGFDNPGARPVGWGLSKGEMCIVFGFSDSPALFLGDGKLDAGRTGVLPDGVLEHEAGCEIIGAVPVVNQ